LQHYRELLCLFTFVQECREAGAIAAAIEAVEEVEQFVRHTEAETARALESYTLLKFLGRLKDRWSDEAGD
jgi:hypothetical protein